MNLSTQCKHTHTHTRQQFGTTLFTMVSSVYGYTIWSMQKGVDEDLEALDSDDGDMNTQSNSTRK